MARTQKKSVFPIVIGAIVVLGVIAVVATALGGGDDGGGGGIEQVRSVTVSGEPLPELSGAGNDPATGSPIPEVTGSDFDGTEVAIRRDGTPKLIMFLAHWCPHCQDEVPVVTDWLEKNGDPDGVQLLSVSTGVASNQPNYPPSRWLEREGWKVPVLVDDADSTTSKVFGLSGFPFFVATDAQGRVVARADGAQPVAQLEAMIAAARG
ncbi:MAG TPA: TlpA disulfide reductase family protein [Acidimicrobiia bacterium]|nr:TlpA disulfide reductase family protein [Acidimicrobiia bacterium]